MMNKLVVKSIKMVGFVHEFSMRAEAILGALNFLLKIKILTAAKA